jgi:two-component system cell cycle sensor histidine kinase/response regulator CckA
MDKPKAGSPGAGRTAGRETSRRRIAALERRLEEAEDCLKAIRAGEVDALIIKGPRGDQVYSLKDADRPYRSVIEKMRDGAVTIRGDGLVLYANTQFAAILGVPLERVIGANLFEWVEAPGLESLKKLVDGADERGVAADVEFRAGSGSSVVAHVSLAPMMIDDIRVLSGVVADMTEERRTRRENEQLAAVVSQTVEGVIILDAARQIVYANPACLEITGFDRSDLIGLGPERLGREAVERILSAVEKEGAWKGRLARTRKDGIPIELDLSVAPLKTGTGAVANYIVVFRDVTLAGKIEKRVRQMERTEALGRLAGGIAHDVNNILMPIIVNAELLLEEADPGSRRYAMLNDILDAAKRQRDLIKRILSFTRQVKLAHQDVPLAPIVEEALKFIRPSIEGPIQVRFTADDPGGTIRGDATELHELVTNLCANAVDAMAGGGGILDITLTDLPLDSLEALPELKPGRYVRLRVKDTGCGIAPYDLEHIFDPFFTTKQAGKGTGIGLSVVRGIVKNHGGSINVESVVGQGTDVSVYLPKATERASGDESRASVRGPVSPGRRILLVDDEELILDTMRRALVSFGHRPTATVDAAEALALFRKAPEQFDLAIIDQNMPRMSGLELAAGLQQARPGFPIILATGYSRAVNEESLRAAGIGAAVMKPLTLKDLSAAIGHVLAFSGRPV